MTAQSVVKHFLTERDKLLIFRLSPLADQGVVRRSTNRLSHRAHRVPTHRRVCPPRHRRPV
ncbi:hypothetical protein EDB86DRAFT_2926309, partial [Lactarius hatsudake]